MAGPMYHTRVLGRAQIACALLSGNTATTAGSWVYVGGFQPFNVDITATNGTVKLRGSNATGTPTTCGVALATIVNERRMINVSAPVRWAKCMITSRTGGTITANLVGRDA